MSSISIRQLRKPIYSGSSRRSVARPPIALKDGLSFTHFPRTCTCDAYPFPHRIRGGRCRHPDPPAPVKNRGGTKAVRIRWRRRRLELARREGLHPIRHRTLVAKYLEAIHENPKLTVWLLMDDGERKTHPELEPPARLLRLLRSN